MKAEVREALDDAARETIAQAIYNVINKEPMYRNQHGHIIPWNRLNYFKRQQWYAMADAAMKAYQSLPGDDQHDTQQLL